MFENDENGVYLWGALVLNRAHLTVPQGYHAFCDWTLLTADGGGADRPQSPRPRIHPVAC
jgi:hypothetical protein